MNKNSSEILTGPIYKSMIAFAIPVFLSSVINLMFNAVDLIVVGQYCGSHAIAAVGGGTSRVVNLSCCLFIGFASGFGVVLSHAIGHGDKERISRAVNTAIPFAIILGIILTIFGLCASRWLLEIMNTPEDIIDDAALYLRIYFGGVTLRLVMQFVFNIMRMSGDSRTPTLLLTIGGVLNVFFNIFFVKVLGMTVDGVAFGTVISEGVASVVGIILLMRRSDELKLDIKLFCLDKEIIKKTTKLGIPMGLQTGMFSLSNLILSSATNTLGTTVVTSASANTSLSEIFFSSISTGTQSAVSTFIGQNYGAGNFERIKKIMKAGLVISGLAIFTSGILVNIFSRPLAGMYITDNPEAVEQVRVRMLISGLPHFILSMSSSLASTMQGMGEPKKVLYVNLVTTCLFRVIWAYTIFQIPECHNYIWLAISYPISWVLTLTANSFLVRYKFRHMNVLAKKQEIRKKAEVQN